MYSHFFFLPLLSIFLTGCRTEGISFNKVDRIIQYPYTAGSRIGAPPKGVCLRYAVVTQYQLKKLAGIASRIMIVRCYDGDRLLPKHAILVYRAANENIHLADNNHEFPVLAKPGGDDMVWANQMMDPMSGVHAVVLESNHDPHLSGDQIERVIGAERAIHPATLVGSEWKRWGSSLINP